MQDTSLKAYKDILDTLGDKQRQVLETIKYFGICTDRMISESLRWNINSVTGRTNELVKLGIIEDKLKQKCPISGRTSIWWGIK